MVGDDGTGAASPPERDAKSLSSDKQDDAGARIVPELSERDLESGAQKGRSDSGSGSGDDLVQLSEPVADFAGYRKTWGDLTGIDEASREKLFKDEGVRAGLRQRHIQMLALAGAIGTGIFLGSGKALHRAGPLGLLLGYLATSTVVISMMFCLCEVATLAPVTSSYIRHASIFVDDALGFSVGWNLAYGSAVSVPGEVVSCYVLVQFWNKTLSPAIFVTIFSIVIVFSNLIMVRIFGELEFAFAILKIALIVGLIIFGICIDAGAGPNGEPIGFRYWRNPGVFASYLAPGAVGRWFGFWSTLVNGAYSFAGVESLAMAAAETQNPRQALPQATKRIFARILVFYILALFVVSLIVSSNDPELLNTNGTASASPFTIAAQRAGVTALPSIVNAGTMLSAWSSANHGILSGSRSLFGLAQDKNAPAIFLKTHRFGVPWVAVAAVCAFLPLGYTCLNSSATEVFGYFQSVTAASTLWQWMTICIISLRLYYGMRKQGISRDLLPWRCPLQPYLGWYGLCGSLFILVTGGWTLFVPGHFSVEDLMSSYASPVFNLILLFGWKFAKRTRTLSLTEMPIQPWITQYQNNPETPLPKRKGWRRIITVVWA